MGRVVTVVSKPTLAVSRHIREEVRGHEHGRVVANATDMWTGACGHRCAGIEDAPALDARTWHRDRWYWTHRRGTWDR